MAKRKLNDEEFLAEIEQLRGQVADYSLGSSPLEELRSKATYEYAGLPLGHLAPQGVSSIVDSSTTEVVDGYTAILSELLFDNNKIAKFKPTAMEPKAIHITKVAEDITNNEIFIANDGWLKLNSWAKAGILWKNSIIRWDWCEEFCYEHEEFEEIDETMLDTLLSDDNMELVGDLIAEEIFVPSEKEGAAPEARVVYKDVTIRKKIDKSGVKFDVIPHENFSIDRNARSLDKFTFIQIEEDDVTKSDLRSRYPDVFGGEDFDDDQDWSDLDTSSYNFNSEKTARKEVTGESAHTDISNTLSQLDENTTFNLIECWLHADRDGDGIAELRRVVFSGTKIIVDEYADKVNLAALCPIEIPFEFYGLSMADVTRSATMTSTAILRGFVENVYLTNFSQDLQILMLLTLPLFRI